MFKSHRPPATRVTIGLSAFVLALAALMPYPSVGQSSVPPTAREAIADPARFESIPVAKPAICNQLPQQCGRQVLAMLGSAGPFRVSTIRPLEETFTFNNDVVVFLYTVLGFEDDSIDGERFRIAYKRTADGLVFVQVGQQRKCGRGRTDDWTKARCS